MPTPKKKSSRLKKVLISIFLLLVITAVLLGAIMQLDRFASPVVDATRTYKAPFSNGLFANSPAVPVMTATEKPSFIKGWTDFLFKKIEDATPSSPIPTQKTDLKTLDKSQNVIVWMGHSSFFIQLDGKTYLIDPVFSQNASPVPFTIKAFEGTNIYTADDLPSIDVLLLSHDHWDHLDESTLKKIKSKVTNVVVPVGVDSYLTQWGYDNNSIKTGDWNDEFTFDDVTVHVLQAQHYSGRLFKRNETLWCSFALVTSKHKIYLSGDSGYGEFFKDIGKRFGSFDVAIIENGQYNKDWAKIHMMPEETAQTALDLNAKAMIPCHNSKFNIAKHAWYDPLADLTKASEGKNFVLKTPLIGQRVDIDNTAETFKKWWEK